MVRQMPDYLVGVEAVQDSVVSVWDTRTFRGLTRPLPQLVENALFITSFSFDWYIAAHAALSSQTAQERLSHILFEYAAKAGRKVAGAIEVEATNQELADAANLTVYTASRLIAHGIKQGCFRSNGAKSWCAPRKGFSSMRKK